MLRIPSDDGSVWDFHPFKSLEPYGFSGIFYRKYWEIVKNIVKDGLIEFVRECFRVGQISKAVDKTFKVFISKTDKAFNFNHFWPISLCNFSYKMVAKILTTRLSVVVEKLVPPNQGDFVKGRCIA